MTVFSGILRRLDRTLSHAASKLRIARLRLLYPGFSADRRTYIGPGCDIFCSNDSVVRLRGTELVRGVYLHADDGGTIELFDSFVGRFGVVTAHDRVTIGPGVALAEAVTVRDQDHIVDANVSLAESGARAAPVAIGRGAWIGAKATVLKGVTIGDHATVGAGAVVTSSIPANETFVGVPARRHAPGSK